MSKDLNRHFTKEDMKRFSIPSILMVMALLVASCTGSKKVAYFQNLEQVNLEGSKGLYDAKIMPKDMLMITVSTLTPEAAAPFNLTVGGSVSSSGQLSGGSSYGLQGVWIAMAIELTFRGFIFLIRFHSDRWMKGKKIV